MSQWSDCKSGPAAITFSQKWTYMYIDIQLKTSGIPVGHKIITRQLCTYQSEHVWADPGFHEGEE